MGYVYDINHTSNDKKSRNCLFATHGMMSVITLFVSTFLVAHIYSFNGNIYDYIFNVGLFNMVSYATIVIFGFLFGYEKKFLRNKVLSQNKSESDLNTINIEEKK